MTLLCPSYETSLNKAHNEVRTRISGFWAADEIKTYLDDLDATVMPLVKERKPIHALVEFDEFVPQDGETAKAISAHLKRSVKFGLVKVAVVSASALVQLQYRRLSDGIKVKFFDSVVDGQAWLRSDA